MNSIINDQSILIISRLPYGCPISGMHELTCLLSQESEITHDENLIGKDIDRFPNFSLGEVGHAQWTSSCGKIAVVTSKQFSVAMLGPTPLKRTAKSAAYLTKDY